MRPGYCPQLNPRTTDDGNCLPTEDWEKCLLDEDCTVDQSFKCCHDACNFRCVEPLQTPEKIVCPPNTRILEDKKLGKIQNFP